MRDEQTEMVAVGGGILAVVIVQLAAEVLRERTEFYHRSAPRCSNEELGRGELSDVVIPLQGTTPRHPAARHTFD